MSHRQVRLIPEVGMNPERTTTRLGDLLSAVHVKMHDVTDDEVRRALDSARDNETVATAETQTKSVDMQEDGERVPFASTRTA